MTALRRLGEGPCVALVTGASRGLGLAICHRLYDRMCDGSVLMLTARDLGLLEETRRQLLQQARAGVQVLCESCDLSEADDGQLRQIVTSLARASSVHPHWAVIVHNAGSVGDVSLRADQHDNIASLAHYFQLNVTSAFVLNAAFISEFHARVSGELLVLNISSLTALQPFVSMSVYCSVKAARDAFFAVLAAEHKTTHEPHCRLDVLSYAPGPLVTDMTLLVAENSHDAELRQTFSRGRQDGFLSCEQSAARMFDILDSRCYTSGQHVDYYDELEIPK